MARRTTTEPTLVAGIDLGGTNMSIGIVDPKGRIVGACKRKTKAHEGRDVVLDRIVEGVARACAEAAIEPSDLASVGIGAPSAIDFDQGTVINAGNLGWKNVPLRDLLQQRMRVPVVVDNDVNVAAWGEATLGAGVGKGDLLAVWVGTGVGGGLVLNGGLWRGPLFTAGEIGQVVLQPGGAPGHRTVEEFCSRTAIVRSMETIAGFYPSSRFHKVRAEKEDGPLGSGALRDLYAEGDELTQRVVDASADLLGLAIANQLTVLSLKTVVLGGGVVEALGKPYAAKVRESIVAHVFPSTLRKVEVLVTQLEDKAGVLGAAMLARTGR
jgi:glucokinase